jgi:hypothetical protein
MEWTCAVDRIEGSGPDAVAILVGDDDRIKDVPISQLGPLAVEGAVLRIPVRDEQLDYTSATRDHAEESRRLAELQERLHRLEAQDPGGDLAL